MNSIVAEIKVSASKEFKLFLWSGILFSVVIFLTSCGDPTVATTTKEGFAKARISIIGEALHAFKNDVGRFPYTEEGLSSLISPPNENTNWHGPYIDRDHSPKDGWQNDFIYFYPSKLGSEAFDLYSPGPNGIDDLGEGDDISN